jgi:hypothetical protein
VGVTVAALLLMGVVVGAGAVLALDALRGRAWWQRRCPNCGHDRAQATRPDPRTMVVPRAAPVAPSRPHRPVVDTGRDVAYLPTQRAGTDQSRSA